MCAYVQGFLCDKCVCYMKNVVQCYFITVADRLLFVLSISYMTNQKMNQRMMSNSVSAAYSCLKEEVLHF